MRFLERLAYAALLFFGGFIGGSLWVVHELGPTIDSMSAEILKQDDEIRLLIVQKEIARMKKK